MQRLLFILNLCAIVNCDDGGGGGGGAWLKFNGYISLICFFLSFSSVCLTICCCEAAFMELICAFAYAQMVCICDSWFDAENGHRTSSPRPMKKLNKHWTTSNISTYLALCLWSLLLVWVIIFVFFLLVALCLGLIWSSSRWRCHALSMCVLFYLYSLFCQQ